MPLCRGYAGITNYLPLIVLIYLEYLKLLDGQNRAIVKKKVPLTGHVCSIWCCTFTSRLIPYCTPSPFPSNCAVLSYKTAFSVIDKVKPLPCAQTPSPAATSGVVAHGNAAPV